MHSIITYERVGNIDTSGFKLFPHHYFATKGLVFLDGHIDTTSAFQERYQVSSVQELEAQEDTWVERFEDDFSAFIKALDGFCITKDGLASFQTSYGVSNNTR